MKHNEMNKFKTLKIPSQLQTILTAMIQALTPMRYQGRTGGKREGRISYRIKLKFSPTP